jgi:hypothetical protein
VSRRTLPLFLSLVILILPLKSSYALPIDWHGVFGADTTLIDSYRRIKSKQQSSAVIPRDSQEVELSAGQKSAASFQSYVFRLNPVMIVNDSATLFGEISSGYARGGRFGEDPKQNLEGDFANALYMYNVSSGSNDLVLNKFYAELYADTATYVIGRHSADWGLGAVVNSGDGAWDRHAFVRDGITMKVRLGNFRLEPYWAKIGATGSLTRAHRLREYGISLLYDNFDRDLAFGILYSVKSAAPFESSLNSNILGASSAIGRSEVKLLDLYFRKAFGKFSIAAEAPLLSDNLGSILGAGTTTKVKSKALVLESKYQISNSWNISLKGGQVSGNPGGGNSFEAMYLNPNYQVANLMFRYNLRAVSDPSNINLYDSYITNATYIRLGGTYSTEKWQWDAGILYAKAREVAKAGQFAFNHEKNFRFNAVQDQSSDLGLELDLDFNYQWNNEISIGGGVGYLFTGDYYAFTNDPSIKNETNNSFVMQLRTAIEF